MPVYAYYNRNARVGFTGCCKAYLCSVTRRGMTYCESQHSAENAGESARNQSSSRPRRSGLRFQLSKGGASQYECGLSSQLMQSTSRHVVAEQHGSSGRFRGGRALKRRFREVWRSD